LGHPGLHSDDLVVCKWRGEHRRRWIEAAIGEIRATGDYTLGAIAQKVEMRGVPTMSGRVGATWNEELVRIFLLPGRPPELLGPAADRRSNLRRAIADPQLRIMTH
jgi:hypothetical protein